MTKQVHVINGDTTKYRVKVLIQDRLYNHQEQRYMDMWNTVETRTLDNPGQLQTISIWDSRRIIIEEAGAL